MDKSILAKLPIGASTYNVIARQLELIEVADDAIEQAMERHPEYAQRIYEMFMPLGKFGTVFADYTPALFGSFCNEILERVGTGQSAHDIGYGTAAEVILSISHASTKAPLTQDGTALYIYAWKKAFGKLPACVGDFHVSDSYAGASRDLYDQTCRRIGRGRTIDVPTEQDLEHSRAADIQRGNKMPWMKYQKTTTQLELVSI